MMRGAATITWILISCIVILPLTGMANSYLQRYCNPETDFPESGTYVCNKYK